MNTLLVTFQAVAALLGIGVLGFWVIGRRHLPAQTLAFLSTLGIDIAVPCLTLSSMIFNFSPQTNPGWWHLPLWWVGFTLVALVLSMLSSLVTRKANRGVFAISLFFQNGLFFPLIIITGLFGGQSPFLVQLFLFSFLQPTIMFSTYPYFFGKQPQAAKLNLVRVAFNPVIVSTFVGLFVALVGIVNYVPDFAKMILTMVGAMASPLFMLILGGYVYNDLMNVGGGKREIYWKEIIKFVIVKNLIFPLVFLGILIWLRPEFPVALIIILEAAVPPVTAIPIFAERSGGNRALSSQFVLAGFFASIVSIPVMIYLFSRFFPFPA